MLLSFTLTEAGIGDEYFYAAPPPVFLLERLRLRFQGAKNMRLPSAALFRGKHENVLVSKMMDK